MMDPTKKWTFDYIKREIDKIPKNIYVLLLVKYSYDIKKLKKKIRLIIEIWVNIEQLVNKILKNGKIKLLENIYMLCIRANFQDRPLLKTIEASMKNNFGLKAIGTFFNLPFLELQVFLNNKNKLFKN